MRAVQLSTPSPQSVTRTTPVTSYVPASTPSTSATRTPQFGDGGVCSIPAALGCCLSVPALIIAAFLIKPLITWIGKLTSKKPDIEGALETPETNTPLLNPGSEPTTVNPLSEH